MGAKSSEDKKQFSWILFAKTFKQIWPYIWPSKQLGLQLRFFAAFLIIAINRVLNVLIPVFYKEIVDSLQPTYTSNTNVSNTEDFIDTTEKTMPISTIEISSVVPYSLPNQFRWDLILILTVLKLLSGSGGYLNCIRGLLWIPVLQNAQKKLRLHLFEHIHSMSVKWHQENKRTGAIITLTDRGVLSMNHIISNLIFNVLPTLADIVIAFVFFVTILNIWTGIIVFASIVGYLVATVVLSEWRTKFKKGMVKADNERSAVFVDSIINSETVKCFTGESTELRRYEVKIDDLQMWDWKSDASSKMIMVIQRTMMMGGLLGVSMLAGWYVWTGKFTVGDFVLFSTYVEQLYSPLSMFSACYRILQDACMNMEHMLNVLRIESEINDIKDAKKLMVTKGEIVFNEVYFRHNPSRPILKNISFTVKPGQTYAIVGDSGGGKSTIIKLLMRFYDVTIGSILIDGQDICKVSQKSLRQNIGVVPQNATLFNQDISYNIRYSKSTAGDTEIQEAAKQAQIHDKIMAFSDEYQTKVGENGVKLSGGEKRRIVIARAILEGANIVLLDEPTTGLDLKTEDKVQTSLNKLCQNKTTIIVSHHLSSIVKADKILVLHDGEIVEEGTHTELRNRKGHYEEMWLLEHPEENTETMESESFGCTVPNCTCPCHNTENDMRDVNICKECHCNCHDLEIENQILDILKQESEEGIPFDEYDVSTDVSNMGNEPSQSPSLVESSNPEDPLSGSISRFTDSGEIVLQTIHEVPSAEEKYEAEPPNELDPLMSPKSPQTPKLGKIPQQFSFDLGENEKKEEALFPLVSNYSASESRGKKSDWSRKKSLSLDDDDVKLIISGKSFNLKPKGAQVANLLLNSSISVPLDRSLPEHRLGNRLKRKKRPPLLTRSYTVDNPGTQPISPRSFMEIQKQRKKRQDKLERSQEKERQLAQHMIDEAASVVSLVDDLAMTETLPDYYDEECLNPLCSSVNIPRGLETFRKTSHDSNVLYEKDVSIEIPND